ncbi:hypothetical protein OUZ56_013559 [Daphnia magna]|uniref:Uncharacterized protein n=1 Tax=Daphnia magna TaxID=35525 RepID=A0ABQ9Z691_9CRUS|nr:hypothetical protein OUZ56_013559 [Daphnia magna]
MPFIVEQIVHFVAYRQIADLFTRWALTFCHFSSRNKSRKKCDILKSLALASVNRTLVSKFNSSLLPYTTRQHKKKENNKKRPNTRCFLNVLRARRLFRSKRRGRVTTGTSHLAAQSHRLFSSTTAAVLCCAFAALGLNESENLQFFKFDSRISGKEVAKARDDDGTSSMANKKEQQHHHHSTDETLRV